MCLRWDRCSFITDSVPGTCPSSQDPAGKKANKEQVCCFFFFFLVGAEWGRGRNLSHSDLRHSKGLEAPGRDH